jgi:tetratricopeptide (TPR) repeat protein
MITGGTIERNPPVELFRSLYQDRATAQVTLSRRGEDRTVWFDRGQLSCAASNREAQLVGDLLRTFGLATESVLFSAFERALSEPGRGLAKALAETGAVPAFVAEACVRTLAERILWDTFNWSDGRVTITPLETAAELPVRFDRSNANLILEGLRRLPRETPIPGITVDPRSHPALASTLLLRYQWVTLLTEEADALAKVDGAKSAADCGVEPWLLARLAGIGLIELVQAGKSVEKMNAPEGLAYMNVEIAGAHLSARAAEQMEQQAQLVKNTYRRTDWVNLYEIVGVPIDTPADELLRATHERARLFHPDNHLKPQLADARDALEVLFQKIKLAERTFRSEGNRRSYDLTIANAGLTVEIAPAAPTFEVQKQIAKANYTRARDLFEQADFFPALEMIKQAVEFDPEHWEYWVLLSRVQRKNPKWVRQSAETVRKAIALMPGNVELLFELSEACAAERNETERVKVLKEILQIDAGNRRAQSALAEIAAMKPRR